MKITRIAVILLLGILLVLGLACEGDGGGILTPTPTRTSPSGYFLLWVSFRDVSVSIGEQIEIRCLVESLINTLVDLTSNCILTVSLSYNNPPLH